MVKNSINTPPPRSGNQFASEVWRRTQICHTTASKEQLSQCQVPVMHPTTHSSWQELLEVSKYLFKKCHWMKICKSLVRTKLTETILSRSMANGMVPWIAQKWVNRASLMEISENKMVIILCYLENQMKRQLWKRDLQLHSELQIRVVSIRMRVKMATPSSRIGKYSRTRPTRSVPLPSQQSYLRPKVTNLVPTKRISQALMA